MKSFVSERQQFLLSSAHANTTQANTLLVTGIPAKELSAEALYNTFDYFPGGVKEIWINRNLKDLPAIYCRRLAACDKLESAETALFKTAAKLRRAAIRKAEKSGKADDLETAQLIDAVSVPRPQHRLGKIPFVGKKVDTIDWCRKEIQTCSELLTAGRFIIENDGLCVRDRSVDPTDKEKNKDENKSYPLIDSAFIMFHDQIAAHLAKQSLTHHEPYRMSAKYLEVAPDDVIWSHLSMNPYRRKAGVTFSWTATAVLIIFWALPIALVGVVSNVHGLCTNISWLAWICELPKVVTDIIATNLPPVLLDKLMELLSIILRLLIRLEGIPKRNALELSLMNRYFIFLVVYAFFGVTFSLPGITVLLDLIMNPTSVLSLLAESLPGASTFFTFVILQALGYSIISPLINGLACTTFFGLYMVHKYLFLWVYDQPLASDTGGLFFPKAIQHVFVGLYIQQVCLAALFYLAYDENGNQSAIAEGIFMVVLIVLTAGYHTIMNNSYGPLVETLPLSMKDRTCLNQPAADDHSFVHPAVSRPQRIIWLPKDTGLAEEEERACKNVGIDASYEHAHMDEKGKVDIDGAPPDEADGGS
ncbi:hypothetical protein C0992_005163 [Termitomyces sp. T32_za158]|nr:hypothetical protein C0992_005163 [Termitomyces sp. T32_za158]